VNTRLMLIIDAVLGAAILALVFLILTTRPEQPPPIPDVEDLRDVARSAVVFESDYIARAYPALGNTDVMGVPVPIPRPIPEPPLPAPDLAAMLERVEIWSAFGTEGQIKVDGGTPIDVVEGGTVDLPDNRDQRNNVTVEIADVDDYDFAVTFHLTYTRPAYRGPDIPDELEFDEQTIEMTERLSMFPDPDDFPEGSVP